MLAAGSHIKSVFWSFEAIDLMHKIITHTKVVLLISLLVVAEIALAQDSWVSYVHSISDRDLEGKNFRLMFMARALPRDTDSHGRIWLKVDREKGNGFSIDDRDHMITSPDWKEYEIKGVINPDYKSISFGVICEYNGEFYIDDVVFQVLNGKKWKTIYNNDFESDMNGWVQGNNMNAGINTFYNAELVPSVGKAGKRSMMISADAIPNFGTNSRVGKFADVNGIKLYYEIYGTGKPLVVMHGNGGSSKGFSPLYPRMIEKYKVITIDSRAQGRSTDTSEPLTYEQMASDINELLNQLKIDSAYMFGYSDGAILGLIMAMKHPEKVRRLVSFGANIQPDSTALFNWAIEGEKRAVRESRDPKERKLNQLMLDHPHIPFSDLAAVRAPVLVMAGDRDVITPGHTLKIFQSLPNSQMCIFPGATHGAPWESQELFLQLMFDFFDKPFRMPTTEDWFR